MRNDYTRQFRVNCSGTVCLLFGWMAVIYFLSTDHFSFPELRQSRPGFFLAKGVHCTEYAVLSLLWYRAFNGGLSRWNPSAAALGFVAALIFAALDEVHQSFTIHRNGNAQDVLLDLFGASASMLALWAASRPKPRVIRELTERIL